MSKFEHSVPVPHLYKRAARIVKAVKENGANLKSLVYSEKRIKEIKPIYALATETLQHSHQIDFLLKRTQLLEKEPRFDPWLAKVLITELLWGKRRLPGESKPVKTLLAYEQVLIAHFNDIYEAEQKERKVIKPRYVRVNPLKISISKAIALFKEEGWIYVECDKQDYESFLQKVANLGKEEFMSDIHIEDLLIFPPGTKFHNHEAYLKGSIVLQDKASCLPVHVLNPPPNATVLDMCAAPGMKTSHLAAKMNNKGLIYAVDIDAKRFEALEKLMKRLGVTCVKTINKDVLALTEKDCPGIEYILVDPSCSGSGIVDRLDFDYPQTRTTEERLKKLAGFQILMLKHALRRFPKAKKIVYSTCSVNPEENEAVIQEVLLNCQHFKLVPADSVLKSQWLNFGSPDFVEIGKNCLYAKPEVDQTNGFFVAILERITDYNELADITMQRNAIKKKREKKFEAGDVPDQKRRTNKLNVKRNATGDEKEIENSVNDKLELKRRKRKHSEANSINGENEIAEQKPEKIVKIDEEDNEINNNGSFNKSKKDGSMRENIKRGEQKCLDINSLIKEKKECKIANRDAKTENEKKELKKNGIIKTAGNVNSCIVTVTDFEAANNLESSNAKLKKLAIDDEENEEEPNQNLNCEVKREKRKKKKKIDVEMEEKKINPQVTERKLKKKKKVTGTIQEKEMQNLRSFPEEEKENEERIKQNVIVAEDEAVKNNLGGSNTKRRKSKYPTSENNEAKKEEETKKQKREKKKGLKSTANYEKINKEVSNSVQVEEQKRIKKKKDNDTESEGQTKNLETTSLFELEDKERNQKKKKKMERQIVTNGQDEAIQNNLGTSITRGKKLMNLETLVDEAYINNEMKKREQKKKNKIKNTTDTRESKSEEEENTSYQIEKLKRKKRKKSTLDDEQMKSIETLSQFEEVNINLQIDDQNEKKNKQIITAGENEEITNCKRMLGPSAKRRKSDNGKQGIIDDDEGQTLKKRKRIKVVITIHN